VVGTIEILRDRKRLPYVVARSLGDKKRIERGQVFVRHGSQTEAPTERELDALCEEGEQARSSDESHAAALHQHKVSQNRAATTRNRLPKSHAPRS
jgi:hypothetical protein